MVALETEEIGAYATLQHFAAERASAAAADQRALFKLRSSDLIAPVNAVSRLRWNLGRALCVVAVLSFGGCDSGPQLGAVTGTVTLDSQPLPGAVVIFQPIGGGPSSHAETDPSGHYELLFAADEPGATVGSHTVTVETKRFHIPDSVEKVPARYNRETQLTRDVVAGQQTIDLDLKSD